MIAFVFLIAAQDPEIANLRAEEHSVLDQLDDALAQKKKLSDRVDALSREEKNLAAGVHDAQAVLDKTNARLQAELQTSRTQARALRQVIRGGGMRVLLGTASMGQALRQARMLARWLTLDVHVLSQRFAEASALDERRAAIQHNLDYAHDVTQSAVTARQDAQKNEALLQELLSRVREDRSTHERAYYESKEEEAKLARPSDEVVAGDAFFALRGHLPWPAKVSGLEPFGVFRDPVFGAQVLRSGIRLQTRAYVSAVAPGHVTFAEAVAGLGDVVVIEHTTYFATVYAGLDSLNVHKGSDVIAGALVGHSGGVLDFEIRRGVSPEDPQPWFE